MRAASDAPTSVPVARAVLAFVGFVMIWLMRDHVCAAAE